MATGVAHILTPTIYLARRHSALHREYQVFILRVLHSISSKTT
jgi:hypothetical protein